MKNFVGAPIYYLLGVEENINFGFTSHMADWPMPDKKIEDGAKIAACDHLYYCKYALC